MRQHPHREGHDNPAAAAPRSTPPTTTTVRITYTPADAGWGCTHRAGQMLVANALGGDGVPPPALGEPGFGRWAGPAEVAHRIARRDGRVRVVGASRPLAAGAARLHLVPVRLGADAIEPAYLRRVAELAHFPGFAGAVVGVGRRSYYMRRLESGRALCVDPHLVRLRNRDEVDGFDELEAATLAPSLCLGFVDVPPHLVAPLRYHLTLLPLVP